MRRAAKRDANHATLVAELRAAGYSVSDLSAAGGGCPDLVVSRGPHLRLVEIKAPGALRKAGASKVRVRQLAWAARHPGFVITAERIEDVIAAWPAD